MPREDTVLPRESCGQARHPDQHSAFSQRVKRQARNTYKQHHRGTATVPGMIQKEGPDLLEQQLCRKNQGQHPMARGDSNPSHLPSQDPARDKFGGALGGEAPALWMCRNRASSTFPRNSYKDATHVFTSHRAPTARTSLLSGAPGMRTEPAGPHWHPELAHSA